MSDRPDISSEIPRVTGDAATERAACLSVVSMADRLGATPAEAWGVLEMLGLDVTARELRSVPAPAPVVAGDDPGRQYRLCGNGKHEMRPSNVRVASDGGRRCKACSREAERRRAQARTGAA